MKNTRQTIAVVLVKLKITKKKKKIFLPAMTLMTRLILEIEEINHNSLKRG